MADNDDAVEVWREGRVLVMAFNRPARRNAITIAVADALAAALEELDEDPDLSVGVLTGNGPGFCAGLDLRAFLAGDEGEHAERGFAGLTRRGPDKPLIAAIEGFAVAGGFEIALACDLIVAARDAKIALPEVQRGLVANGGALLRLPRHMAFHAMAELVLLGEPVSAQRLHELGVVNRVTFPGLALRTALELAQRIAANGALAVQATKRIYDEVPELPFDEGWRRQDEIAAPVWASTDAGEGASAFVERRSAEFRGR
jgi:enoyl-CoA hydratase